jgi:hypothetical protein
MKAATLGLLFGLVFGANVAAAQGEEAPITEEARRHFAAGVNLMQDPEGARYEEAYREFTAAYRASPSWKILGNLGIAAMKLERDGEAIEAFTKYLAAGGGTLDAGERAQFESDLSTLKTAVASVKLSSDPPGAEFIDERVPVTGSVVTNRYSAPEGSVNIGVRPGHHRITARLAGYADQVWEFDATSAGSFEKAFKLESAAASASGAPTPAPIAPTDSLESRPMTTGVYVGIGVTGALLVGTAVTGVLALGAKSDYDAANDGSDVAEADELRGSTQTMNLVTDVLLGATVVSAAITTYLFVSRPTEKSASVRIVPVAAPGAGALFVSGRF